MDLLNLSTVYYYFKDGVVEVGMGFSIQVLQNLLKYP